MSSTTDPRQACHIGRLPVELLTKILLNLDPPRLRHQILEGIVEKNPLFQIRLVSKHLHAVCRPILHRDLEVDAAAAGRVELDQLVVKIQASAERAAACRKLLVYGPSDSSSISIRRWAQLVPNVEHFEVSWGVVDEGVADFNKLRHLSMKESSFDPLSAGVRTDLLESLDLYGERDLFDRLRLDRASFSALRHLRIKPGWTARANAPALVPFDLLAQLECLDVDGEAALKYSLKGWLDLDELLRQLPVLWRLDGGRTGRELAALPSYLQQAAYLHLSHGWPDVHTYDTARAELRGLVDAQKSLRLILVSEKFLSTASSPPDGDRDEPIIVECERRGIAVRSYSHDGSLVAPEFIAFVREMASRARSTAVPASRS
ncbi:hypothetical protein JCM8208_004304 [Rhodotorula glutinis]